MLRTFCNRKYYACVKQCDARRYLIWKLGDKKIRVSQNKHHAGNNYKIKLNKNARGNKGTSQKHRTYIKTHNISNSNPIHALIK